MLGFNSKIIQLMVTKPLAIWELIRHKSQSKKELVLYLLLPLVILYAIALLLNVEFTGNIVNSITLLSAFLVGIVSPVSVLFLSAWIIHRISKPLGTTITFLENFTMVIYSSIPYFIIHILVASFDLHAYFEVIGAYSIYVYFTACKKYITITERHFVSYIFISVFIFLAINTIINYIIGSIHLAIYLS